MLHLKKYAFVYAVVPLIVLTAAASFYRFMVQKDYLVSFQGYCDPEVESCYWGDYYDEDCESEDEDECMIDYYYRLVEKPFSTFERQISGCSEVPFYEYTEEGDLVFLDPSFCELVDTCEETEIDCTIEYCDNGDPTNECNKFFDS